MAERVFNLAKWRPISMKLERQTRYSIPCWKSAKLEAALWSSWTERSVSSRLHIKVAEK
jgi:hypothetical protein